MRKSLFDEFVCMHLSKVFDEVGCHFKYSTGKLTLHICVSNKVYTLTSMLLCSLILVTGTNPLSVSRYTSTHIAFSTRLL